MFRTRNYDDNNYWLINIGIYYENIDSNEEGYDEKGYKLNTKELLENEYSIKLSKMILLIQI